MRNRNTFRVLGFSAAFFGILFLLGGCGIFGPVGATQKGGYDLYLLVGQSNMAGRGEIGRIDTTLHPRVFALDSNGIFVPAREPLHFDKKGRGTGPGLAFGKAMAEAHPKARIGLIPAAFGGTKIAYWKPGHKRALYERALRMARIALESGQLKGIVWQQGESDSNAKDAPLYKARLIQLIQSFRRDLGAPELPVVLGGLGDFLKSRRYKLINQALKEVADEVPNVGFSKASTAGHIGDRLHFNATAQHENGMNMAAAMLKLTTR